MKMDDSSDLQEMMYAPSEEFKLLEEELLDLDDLRALRDAKVKYKDAPTYTISEAKKELGL
jgi:hypothetical protein